MSSTSISFPYFIKSIWLHKKIEAFKKRHPNLLLPDHLLGQLSGISDLLNRRLDKLFFTLSSMMVKRFLDWELDKSNLGYVKISQADLNARVPFYLLDDFPRSDSLASLISLSKKISVGEGHDSIICLSGSTTMLNSLGFISDLDFCEYYNKMGSLNPPSTRSISLISSYSKDFFCTNVYINSGFSKKSWSSKDDWSDQATRNEFLVHFITAEKSRYDYLGKVFLSKFSELIEITNMVFPVSSLGRETLDNVTGSFSFQEAPLGSIAPRRLTSPVELGRFLGWLLKEIEKVVDKKRPHPLKLVKASKRALLLAKITNLKTSSEKILQTLLDSKALVYVSFRERQKLKKKIVANAPNTAEESYWLNLLEETLNNLEKHLESKKKLKQPMRQHFHDFSATVTPILFALTKKFSKV